MSTANVPLAVLAALGAAATFALSAVGQQRAAASAPASDTLRLRLIVRLARRHDFLLATAALVAAYGLQAIGLALGTVALVEPIVATELVFAIPLAIHLRGLRPAFREWLSAAAVAGGVSVFLLAASPRSSAHPPSALRWAIAFGACTFIGAFLLVAASGPPTRRRAALLACAGGVANGLVALVTKSFLDILRHGIVPAFASWQPYVIVAVGFAGFLFSQSAFQAAPLADSLPVLDVLEPTTAVLLAALVLGEMINLGAIHLASEAIGAGLVIAGIVVLGRSPLVLDIYERQRRDQSKEGTARRQATGGRGGGRPTW